MNIMVVLFLVIIIFNVINKAKTENRKTEAEQMPYQSQSTPPATRPAVQDTKPMLPHTQPARQTMIPAHSTVQNTPIQLSQAANLLGNGNGIKEPAKEQKQTTTEYLAEKAATDRREHDKEDKKVQNRMNQFGGNTKSGERLLLGDLVPTGKMKLVCRYCGADNMVAQNITEPCHCYFCRELL